MLPITLKNKIALSKLFVLIVFGVLALVWLGWSEMSVKEMQIMCIVETHAEKGLGFTKGYNVYPEEGKYSAVPNTKQGGVRFFGDAKYTAYVSVPVLTPLSILVFYEAFGLGAAASKVFFVFFGFICVLVLFRFSDRFVEEGKRPLFNLFMLSPFFLFNYYYNDINLNPFVLCFSLLSYLAFLKYLKDLRRIDLGVFALCLLINTWSSFFVLSLYPVFILHVLFDKRIAMQDKVKRAAGVLGAMVLILASVAFYYSQLPHAIERAMSRAGERIEGTKDMGKYEEIAEVPLTHFASKLIIRLASHYTPVALLLSGLGLAVSLRLLIKEFRQNRLSMETTSLEFVTCMWFWYGFPASILLYTGSFVHAYFTYQWIPFFVVGSLVGLNYLVTHFPRWTNALVIAMIGAFLVFSIPRSIAKVTNQSLVDLLFGGNIPSWYKQSN